MDAKKSLFIQSKKIKRFFQVHLTGLFLNVNIKKKSSKGRTRTHPLEVGSLSKNVLEKKGSVLKCIGLNFVK